MFSGIVQACIPVVEVETKPGLVTFSVELEAQHAEGVTHGASIAIDGVCLTVTRQQGRRVTFDAIEETQRLTTLGGIDAGRRVNIERSVTAQDEIGGHTVSGHVHTTALITAIDHSENNQVGHFQVPAEWLKYIFPKGFVALDGCSLTVVDVDKATSTFTVHFIPETIRATTFGFKLAGDRVNIEVDQQTRAIVDTVERVLADRLPELLSLSS